jgi:hypothetical protein
MKKSLVILVCSFFISCGVQTKLIIPESLTTFLPELNKINNTEIGITLVSKETGYKYNAIKITKGKKAKPRYNVKEIKEGDVYINDSYTSKFNLYTNISEPTFGIAVPKNGEKAIVFANNGMGINFFQTKDIIEYTLTYAPVPKKEYFKQEFIYNGRVANALKFMYREYIDDLARPAFTQDLQYDLSESKIIGFRGLRIEVISATNTNIEYKVLNQFQK